MKNVWSVCIACVAVCAVYGEGVFCGKRLVYTDIFARRLKGEFDAPGKYPFA